MENENKLPPDFKAKWVEALRSGQYQQGKCNLFADNSYCCLGVAGILNGLTNKEMLNKSCAYDKIYSQVTPSPLHPDIIETLTGMNDGFGDGEREYSFSEIADYIEQNL